MADAGFFRGTSSEQDNRFSDKEKKLLKQMKFADNLTTKVEMNKVKLDVLKPWISKRISELLGMEDDVIVEFVINQLEAEKNPDARKIQINLTGFLNGKNARIFTGELWEMLISAQSNASGIPASMVEEKKQEILKRQEDRDRISETIKRTVSRFTDKLKPEGESSPPNRRSNSRERDSKRSGKYSDVGDKGKPKDDSRSTQSKRNYRSRRSASNSPDRDKRVSRSRSNSRDRRDRDRRNTASRGSRDNSRDWNRGGRRGMGRTRDNRDRLTQRRSRSRSRSPQGRLRSRSRSPNRGGGGRSRSPSPRAVRRRSPLYESRSIRNDSNYRDAPVRPRLSADRDREGERHRNRKQGGETGSRSITPEETSRRSDKVGTEEDSHTNNYKSTNKKNSVPPPPLVKDAGKRPGSGSPGSKESSSSATSAEDDGNETKSVSVKRKLSPVAGGSENSDEERAKKQKKEKKKKDKKHKKQKKQKKIKKSKDKDRSSSEDEADSANEVKEDENTPNIKGVLLPNEKYAQSFRKLVQTQDPPASSEDLERKLREKALESMKKAGLHM